MPKTLRYLGKLPNERILSVAIVGSRKPTRYGQEVAARFASELAAHGVVIVSGLALGIDAIAHRAALGAGGTTLAVLGNGLSKIYPATNTALGERILSSGGAIISEYADDIPPYPANFLARNRIVSGLSDAVLVVEANERSGTLSTAAHALGQGRLVFAVPGNITSPLSAGCNKLLKQGAYPATSPDDILRELGLLNDKKAPKKRILPDDPDQRAVLEQIFGGISDGEKIMVALRMPADRFGVAVTLLEIGGFVKSLGANKWCED
jgi:DNA processing protein